ncbi:hypothetical protein ACFX5U_08150 [Sphingobacterium sp. SG20118]|uniref:hypothetical protein n=1 Tax=Sphingobacterium sp. SG20118 TaxID=3367156 RepID=UPI0037DFC2F8
MKKFLKLLILSITLVTLVSCKDDEEIIACPDIYVALVANINYVDGSGKDLVFVDNPIYPPENIKMYKVLANDQTMPISFTIIKNEKFLAVNLDKVENGTFYIELKPGVTDKITYAAKIDESSPCKDYKLIDIKQNDALGQYEGKTQIWTLKK